ncbi:MAG: HIT family protein [Anaerolineae bacterium]
MKISHAPIHYQCPFCLLRDGIVNDHTLSRESDIVYRTDRVIAFVASHQWRGNYPNVLVIPTEHYENLYSMPADYGNDIQQAMQSVARALKAIYNCDGVSTRQHNEPAGYQDVWHYHMHVTPRFKRDQFYAKAGLLKRFMPEEERKPFADALKTEIQNQQKS